VNTQQRSRQSQWGSCAGQQFGIYRGRFCWVTWFPLLLASAGTFGASAPQHQGLCSASFYPYGLSVPPPCTRQWTIASGGQFASFSSTLDINGALSAAPSVTDGTAWMGFASSTGNMFESTWISNVNFQECPASQTLSPSATQSSSQTLTPSLTQTSTGSQSTTPSLTTTASVTGSSSQTTTRSQSATQSRTPSNSQSSSVTQSSTRIAHVKSNPIAL